jgi:hypothetical protein|tara:strand:- start:310 stop:579 length:270 start_codon:yes stop_codon:yes gene_type:complete
MSETSLFKETSQCQTIKLKTMNKFTKHYVIYDKANDRMLCFGNGDVILFADHTKAVEDLYGNEVVVQVRDLSQKNQLIILNQINHYGNN